jgi:hypothetical protein
MAFAYTVIRRFHGGALTATPLCCPSRASMLTGQYGHIENIAPAPPGSPAAAREEDLADRLATLRTCAGIAGRDPAPIGRTYCE